MKPAHDAFVFIWSPTLAPWLVNVSMCVSQVCVRFSARGYDIRYRGGTVLKSLCVYACKRSVCRLLCYSGRQCVCLWSTQWPLSGLHSALKLSGSVFTAWSTGTYQGFGQYWQNWTEKHCRWAVLHEEEKALSRACQNKYNPDSQKLGALYKT